MALSVTRRAAVKKFGFGLTTLALAALGLTNKAEAARGGNLPGAGEPCTRQGLCGPGLICLRYNLPSGKHSPYTYICRPPGGDGAYCNTAADCMPGMFCYYYGSNPTYGTCRPYPSPLSAPCNSDANCQPGLACHRFGGIAGGYCTSP
jgi:hypothetical protein